MKNKISIYYESPIKSSFVDLDISKLSKDFDVITYTLPWSIKSKTITCWIKQFYILVKYYKRIDVVICSFAGYHSFLPIYFCKLKNIPSFIILNGTESVGIKEIKYGSLLKWPLKSFIYWSLKGATELWPVSKYLLKGESNYVTPSIEFGINYTYPNLKTSSFVIPNGIELDFWISTSKNLPRTTFNLITVLSGMSQYERKGIDIIVQSLPKLYNCHITIVGLEKTEFTEHKNLTVISKTNRDQLRNLFHKNDAYIQLSYFEAFGVSLIEAMSTGLIPIGSSVCAIPDIINDSGKIVNKRDPELLIAAINELASEDAYTKNLRISKAKEIVQKFYSIESRIKLIISRIENYKKVK